MASDLVFVVKAKTDSAAASFKKLTSSILPIKKASDETAASMAKINKTKVSPKVDDSAIKKTEAEIRRLQEELRKQITLDVNADTRETQRKIRGLQSTLRSLKAAPITPELRTSGFKDKITSALSSVSSGLQRVGSGFADVFRNVGIPLLGSAAVAVAGIGTALGLTAVKAISLADQMERAKLQMDSFTGNTKTTVKLLQQVQAYADKTPFEFPELASAAKRLLGVGTAAGKIPAQLGKIGDIAAQSGASVDDLALIFSQMVSAGRVNAEDMNQLADRGIAAWPKLAKALGLSVAQVRELSSKGKLGAKDVQLLWDTLANGAKGSTDALSNTLSGQISTLKDTVNGVLRDIGNALLPFAKTIVPQLTVGVQDLGGKVLGALPKIIDVIAAGLQELLKLPGQILRGLASVSEGFMFMVSDIQASLADLVSGMAQVLAGIPGISDKDVSGLRAAADSLRGAAVSSAAKGGTLFDQLTEAAKKADTAVTPLKGKIEEARKIAQQGIVMSVSVRDASAQIASLQGKLDQLKKAKSTPQVRADIKDTQARLDKAKAYLDLLNKYTANPKLLVHDLNSGKVTIDAKGRLQSVKNKTVTINAKDNTGKPTSSAKAHIGSVPQFHDTTLNAHDHVSGPAKNATQAINDIPSSKDIYLRYIAKVSYAGGTSPSQIPGSLNPGPKLQASSAVAPAQVSVYVRDQSLAKLVDIRVNQRAVRAARIIHRRDTVTL